jgi:hypothetical protein
VGAIGRNFNEVANLAVGPGVPAALSLTPAILPPAVLILACSAGIVNGSPKAKGQVKTARSRPIRACTGKQCLDLSSGTVMIISGLAAAIPWVFLAAKGLHG